jgi:hypothetical protein
MPTDSTVFAYFGSEVQLPLVSMIGVFSGIALIVGGAPVRLIRRYLREMTRKDSAS